MNGKSNQVNISLLPSFQINIMCLVWNETAHLLNCSGREKSTNGKRIDNTYTYLHTHTQPNKPINELASGDE